MDSGSKLSQTQETEADILGELLMCVMNDVGSKAFSKDLRDINHPIHFFTFHFACLGVSQRRLEADRMLLQGFCTLLCGHKLSTSYSVGRGFMCP